METTKPDASHPPDAAIIAPPRPHGRSRQAPAGITAVSYAVRMFLTTEFGAREVRVTRIATASGTDAGWEAEAEILVPDLAIKTLGLPLTQEVLERRRYAVQVDPSLAVRGYEPLDHDG
jgi:hypothetical protein